MPRMFLLDGHRVGVLNHDRDRYLLIEELGERVAHELGLYVDG